jgi:hypothetical protein
MIVTAPEICHEAAAAKANLQGNMIIAPYDKNNLGNPNIF